MLGRAQRYLTTSAGCAQAIGSALRLALVLVGCAGSNAAAVPPSKPPAAEPAPAGPDCSNQLPDAVDVCTLIPHECPTYEDLDGCPDFVIALGPQCSAREDTTRNLDDLAGELLEDPRLTLLELYGEQGCSEWVKSELVQRGVSAERLATKLPHTPEANMVYPEVAAYGGKKCP